MNLCIVFYILDQLLSERYIDKLLCINFILRVGHKFKQLIYLNGGFVIN